jgi:ABC-type phosphate transport system substrate-binding protein
VRGRRHRGAAVTIAGLAAVVLGCTWQGAAFAAKSGGTSTVTPVLLNGSGSWDVSDEITDWSNTLYGKSGNLTMNYIPTGGYLGRQDFVAGQDEFVISGVGFTSAQLKELKGGASDIIEAPVMPSAVGFMFQPPTGDFDVVNSTTGAEVQHYDGPFNIPIANITAMMLDYGGIDPSSGGLGDSYVEWDDPAIDKTWPGLRLGAGDELSTSNYITLGPLDYGRSEPNETSYYLQQLIIGKEKGLWDEALSEDDDPKPPTIHSFTETFPPYVPVATRQGVELQVQALLANVGSLQTNGTVADVPPSAMAQVKAFNKNEVKHKLAQVEVKWLGVPNKDGQYLDPTPATIDAAVDAGGATPLYALNHRVKGGYPLTYIDDLYAPAHGLTMYQTDGVATLIRYLVTDGQKIPARYGDGRLSPTLIQQALTAANTVVKSNCTQSGESVLTTTNPGDYAPKLPGIDGIGDMELCVATSSLPTTTTTSTSTTVPVPSGTTAPPSGSTTPTTSATSSPPSTSTTTTATTVPPTTTPKTTPTTRPTRPKKATAVVAVMGSNDLEAPESHGGFDHLAALLIGAGLLLLLRRPTLRLVRMLRS